MSRSTLVSAVPAVVLVCLAAACGGSDAPAVDFVKQLGEAQARGNQHTVIDQTIEGETLKAISVNAPSRLVYKVRVPQDGWLRTSLALKPDAWTKEGDGVLFRIGISDGRNYEQLLNQHVNPFKVQADRRWIPVNLDLSAYSDQDVEVIFNTNGSVPGTGSDTRNDMALWGAPQIYVR